MTELRPTVLPPGRFGRPVARSSGAAAALLALLWYAISHELADRSATGLLARLAGGLFVPLLRPVFLLFLLAVGWSLLEMVRRRSPSLRELFGLPARPTASREWALGSALGWGIALLAVLPLALGGALYPQLWLEPRGWLTALIGLLAAGLSTLAVEAAFRGYTLKRLQGSLGPAGSSILLSALYAVMMNVAFGNWIGMLVSFLFGLLLSMAWFRTHGLWFGWGINFAWRVILGLLFGLPVAGGTDLASVVQTQAEGARWLTGAGFGPSCAPWTLVVVLLAMPLLFRLTRDYAWSYTHAPIVPAGYPMDVPPPPAHEAMEKSAPPPPLVQIAPATAEDRSRTDGAR